MKETKGNWKRQKRELDLMAALTLILMLFTMIALAACSQSPQTTTQINEYWFDATRQKMLAAEAKDDLPADSGEWACFPMEHMPELRRKVIDSRRE